MVTIYRHGQSLMVMVDFHCHAELPEDRRAKWGRIGTNDPTQHPMSTPKGSIAKIESVKRWLLSEDSKLYERNMLYIVMPSRCSLTFS